MEKILDFLFGEKDEILIKQNIFGGLGFSYTKSELLHHFHKGYSFRDLEQKKRLGSYNRHNNLKIKKDKQTR